MIKRIYAYTLPEGTDEEAFWKYHTRVHAKDSLKAMGPRLKKFTINRVKTVIDGHPTFFALVENWFDNEEDMNRAINDAHNAKTADGKNNSRDWDDRIATHFSAMVEEYIGK